VTPPSGMARRLQQAAAEGPLGDSLRLPFMRILQEVQAIRLGEAYRRLVTAGACALSAGQQEALYLDTVRGLTPADLDVLVRAFHQMILDMEDRPYTDLLGPVYMAIGHTLDKQAGGEYFTPQSVSLLLARLMSGPDLFIPGQILMCNEPAAGTGGMVLACAQVLAEQGLSPLHTRWVIQDISARSCYAAYINATLWGIPAHVVCGDTLRLEYRWQWTNLFWQQARPWPTAEEQAAHRAEVLRAEYVLSFLRGLGAA
jgi:N-6 DNA Methylase